MNPGATVRVTRRSRPSLLLSVLVKGSSAAVFRWDAFPILTIKHLRSLYVQEVRFAPSRDGAAYIALEV